MKLSYAKFLSVFLVFYAVAIVTMVAEATAGQQLSVKISHTVLLDSDGTVWTWGNNEYGQLGDGGTSHRNFPVQVLGSGGVGHLQGVMSVAAGDLFSVALKNDGTVWAWGDNKYGELGNENSPNNSPTPVQVRDSSGTGYMEDVVAIAGGGMYTLALKSDGTVWGWGENGYGVLGTDFSQTPFSTHPIQVTGLTDITAIATGYQHSMALKSDGTVWAWGFNLHGQLGDNTFGDLSGRYTPALVKGIDGNGLLTGAIKISAGKFHSLALLSDGTVKSWGYNASGQLGDGSRIDRPAPVSVSGLEFVNAIAAGDSHSFAIFGGTPFGWGANNRGQLGDGSTTERLTPVPLSSPDKSIEIACGSLYTAAITADSKVYSWGYNNIGQLGDGTVIERHTPAIITGRTFGKITAIAAGASHSTAVESDGTVWTWGDNLYGQLGNDSYLDNSFPDRTAAGTGLAGITSPTAGLWNTLALSSKGTIYSWGDNTKGQLGTGDYTSRNTPGYVWLGILPFFGVKSVAATGEFSLALKREGTVWGWGDNFRGQLGDGTTTGSTSPVQSWNGQLEGVSALDAGGNHAVALLSDGTVRTWGDNQYGQLGDGTVTNSTTAPKQLKYTGNLSMLVPQRQVVAVAAGYNHSLALLSDGSVRAWGNNSSGQLGDNTLTNRSSAIQVETGRGYLSGVRAIAAGSNHSLALLNDGTVWAWGYNISGQLGDGSTTSRFLPVQVKYAGALGTPLTGVVAIAASVNNSMALLSDGTVRTWGQNNDGQLGDNTYIDKSNPTETQPIHTYTLPSVFFTSTPALISTSSTGAFTFVSDQLNSTFSCEIDGVGFTSCSSPFNYSTFDGSHTLRVKAFDSKTLTFGAPASFSWTVDLCGFMVGGTCYATIDDAYAAVQNNGMIRVRSTAITSLANFNRADNVAFTLQGGYENSFANPTSTPSVFPGLTISRGRVNARYLVIR